MFVKESSPSLDRWIWRRQIDRGKNSDPEILFYVRNNFVTQLVGEMNENGDSAGTHFVEASLISC